MPVCTDPRLTFNAELHQYKYDGVVVPSVTFVLDAMGAYDFGGANAFQLKAARERGSAVHELIEADWTFEGGVDESTIDERLVGFFEAHRRARVELRMVPAEIEHCVYNKTYRYAGTRDYLGGLLGFDAVLDYKTGYPQRATGPQTSGYANCYKHTAKLPRYGLYLESDGRYELVPYKDPSDFSVFLAALSWLNWRRAGPLSRAPQTIGVSYA
jgi:hypothetical protein